MRRLSAGMKGYETKLRSTYSGGKPICDDFGILRLRLAHSDEKATYYERAQSTEKALSMVYLVELDEDNAAAPPSYPT